MVVAQTLYLILMAIIALMVGVLTIVVGLLVFVRYYPTTIFSRLLLTRLFSRMLTACGAAIFIANSIWLYQVEGQPLAWNLQGQHGLWLLLGGVFISLGQVVLPAISVRRKFLHPLIGQ
jgi:hypothetical protein